MIILSSTAGAKVCMDYSFCLLSAGKTPFDLTNEDCDNSISVYIMLWYFPFLKMWIIFQWKPNKKSNGIWKITRYNINDFLKLFFPIEKLRKRTLSSEIKPTKRKFKDRPDSRHPPSKCPRLSGETQKEHKNRLVLWGGEINHRDRIMKQNHTTLLNNKDIMS